MTNKVIVEKIYHYSVVEPDCNKLAEILAIIKEQKEVKPKELKAEEQLELF